jgi:hypothetical protein
MEPQTIKESEAAAWTLVSDLERIINDIDIQLSEARSFKQTLRNLFGPNKVLSLKVQKQRVEKQLESLLFMIATVFPSELHT